VVHTHDTAGIAISQNLAAIEGGADGIDLAKSPVCGGTCQPDILSMMHVLKGTDFTLDLDYEKILAAEEAFEEAMSDYFFPPEAKMVSPDHHPVAHARWSAHRQHDDDARHQHPAFLSGGHQRNG
jgi:pyruvate carboxylase subunit B